jgi:hypothetical protein
MIRDVARGKKMAAVPNRLQAGSHLLFIHSLARQEGRRFRASLGRRWLGTQFAQSEYVREVGIHAPKMRVHHFDFLRGSSRSQSRPKARVEMVV